LINPINYLKKTVAAIGQIGRVANQNRSNTYPTFNNIPAPTTESLIRDYKRYIFTCVNLNALGCSSVALKAYVTTSRGEKKPRLKTKALTDHKKEQLLQKKANLNSVSDIEEVIDHPLLTLLDKANRSQFLNGHQLSLLTHTFKDLTGKAYWWLQPNPVLGIPLNIWFIPTQYIRPVKETNGSKIVDYYLYKAGNIEKRFPPEQIIQYLHTDPSNPYLNGISPGAAAFEDNDVVNKLISHESGLLANEARPDAIVTPKDIENSFGPDEAERYEKQLNKKFKSGKGGGLLVIEEPLDFKTLNWPPRDIARLEIMKNGRDVICNCFGVPVALLDAKNINKATLEAALTQHAIFAIKPRLDADVAVKNDRLVPLYDDSGRLFLEYENCVPEDKTAYLQETVQLKMNGIITPNESRKRHKYPPMDGGDKLETANTANNTNSGTKRDNARKSGSAKK
jgi:HK97 family phage portal protein